MGSRNRSPQPWPPYPALKDCSQGYCSYYCPQWCYFLFPSPPPPAPPSHALSPLLIAVISIVSTAFLLTAYYLLLSKFRRHFHSPPAATAPPSASSPPSGGGGGGGLDDTLISKLASCQYRPGAGVPVPDGADCPVCLAPFQERDLLRLLPRCDHAFHARCIDVWLRAHSTCPLCRATILLGLPAVSPPPAAADPPRPTGRTTYETPDVEESAAADAIEIGEIVGGTGRLAGRSLSLDSPFRRLQVNADHTNDAGGSSSSTRWTRALHCVVSPVRMKRSSSSSSGGYTRRGRSTMLLPI